MNEGDRDPALSPLLPVALRSAGAPSALARPVGFAGVALFADLVGFTSRTERLARSGREGAEQLAALVDGWFAPIIETIEQAGGDVWVLIGDAALAFWRADADGLEAAVAAAVGAGVAILEQLGGDVEPGGADIELRVSVTAGNLELALLGRPARPLPLLSGSAIDDIAPTDAAAVPGQVTMSAAAAACLPVGCAVANEDRSTWRLVHPPPSVTLAPAAPVFSVRGVEPVLERVAEMVRHGGRSWAAEFRDVSAVFIDCGGASAIPIALRSAMMAELDGVLAEFGVVLDRLLHDDKGVTAVAVVGLPGHRHENDAVRAVRAAAAVLDVLSRHGLDARVGVATGTAFCAIVGSADRQQYTALGEVMNRAARLMGVATAERPVLVDGATVSAASGSVAFDPMGALPLKGMGTPLPIYAPARGEMTTAPSDIRLTGRMSEMARILDRIDARMAGSPAEVIVIEGEAGIGKSALVGAVVTALDAGDNTAAVHVGGSSPTEQATPFRIWRPIVTSILGLSDGPTAPSEIEAALGRFGTRPRRAEVDAVRLALGVADDGGPSISPEAAVLGLADILDRFGRNDGLRVVVLEDVHWADSASWAVYRRLARTAADLVVVMTVRPRESDDHRPAGGHPEGVPRTDIVLGPLGREDVSSLVASVLGVSRISSSLAELIDNRCRGHPLFAQQLALFLQERGLVSIENDAAHLFTSSVMVDSEALPATVTAMLCDRIDALSAPVGQVLKAASIVGRSFGRSALELLEPDLDIDLLLPQMLTSRLVDRIDDERFEFSHALVRDTAYGLLGYAVRREQNLALAEWYAGDDGPDVSPSRLAYHLTEAGQHERAVPHLVAAGHRSLDAGGYSEAAALFRRSIETARMPEPVELASWYERLGYAEQSLGALGRADDALRRSLGVLDRPVPGDRWMSLALVGPASRQLGRRLRWRGVRGGPVRVDPADALVCRSLEGIAQVSYMNEKPLVAMYSLLETANLGEEIPTTAELSRALVSMASLCTFVRLGHVASEHYCSLAESVLRDVEDPRDHGTFQVFRGLHAMTVGDWTTGRRVLAAALEVFEHTSEPRRMLEARSLLGSVEYHSGRIDRALSAYTTVHEDAVALEHRWLEGVGLIEQAMVRLRRGEHDLASDLLDRVDRLGDTISTSASAWSGGLRAALCLELDDPRGAAAAVSSTLERIEGIRPATPFALEGYAGLRMAARHPDVPLDSRARRAAMGQIGQLARSVPMARPRYLVERGDEARATGRRRDARRSYRRAHAAAVALDMPFETGLALLGLAELAEPAEDRSTRIRLASAAVQSLEAAAAAWPAARARELATS